MEQNEKVFEVVAGVIFGIVALVHLVRLVQGWPIMVMTHSVPMWASWLGFIVSIVLAYFGLWFGFRTNRLRTNR